MDLGELIYVLCSVAFFALIALVFVRGRISGVGIGMGVACALTAIWSAELAFPGLLPVKAADFLDSLRLCSWLILMVALVRLRDNRSGRPISLPFLLAVGFCSLVVGYELIALIANVETGTFAPRLHDFLRISVGVGGLLAAENLLRNADEARRRNSWPLCLALGGTFAFELFLYADRLMMGGVDPSLAEGRGLVGLVAVPLLALAMARNQDWRVDIHVSHTVVLHSAALVGSGIFFICLAAIGVFVRELGGRWGPALQLLTLVGSAVVLASAFGSRELRIQLKRLISRHFFSHRFDYRAEWLRFVDTVSPSGGTDDGLWARVVKALAQIVDAPAGTLWCLRDGRFYVLEVGWNMPSGLGGRLLADDEFIKGFRDGTWIQERRSESDAWPFDLQKGTLAIPLSYDNEMIAFVVLALPAKFRSLDSETLDLLRAAGKQAASYLAEERSTRELLDTRLFNEYSKRFAFVIHDIKNLANQLGLVVANARDHIDDRGFQQDMLLTIEDSVARMNRLIAHLRDEGVRVSPQLIEPDGIMADLAQEFSKLGTAVVTRLAANGSKIAIDKEQFRSMLSHLINNAHEASQAECTVVLASRRTEEHVIIDVIDDGPGMDDEFIRRELFRPFRSTKAEGFGIGAYQTREVLRMAGGELDVISEKGVGTVMRVTFPAQGRGQLSSAPA